MTPLKGIIPGRDTPLADLGVADIIGNTHYFRRDVEFTLPDNWLLLANQKARLSLRYGFARTLPQGAILLVKANDETIRLLPLDRNGGLIQPSLPIDFNASLLNPGRNVVSFEMMVPGAPADMACPIRNADMLVVLAETSLNIPTSPAMSLPGMVTPLAGLMASQVTAPEASSKDLFSQTQAIRLASALREPDVSSSEVTLTVIGMNELNLLPLEDIQVTQGDLQNLILPPLSTSPDVSDALLETKPSFNLDEPEHTASLKQDERVNSLSESVRVWLTSPERLWRKALGFLQTELYGSQQGLKEWIAARHGNALLLRPNVSEPDRLWLVLAPHAAMDDVAYHLNNLIDSRSASGEAAVLRTDGSWDVWSPFRAPILHEQLMGGDLRTILGNFASWSPRLFALVMLVLALISAFPALLYVLATRDKKEKP